MILELKFGSRLPMSLFVEQGKLSSAVYHPDSSVTTKPALPPVWIKIASWLFLIYLAVPLLALWQIRATGGQLSISAYGLRLEGGREPLAWILAIDALLFLGGLTALFLLIRRRFAYDFGIFYCASTLVFTVACHLILGAHYELSGINAIIHYSLLCAFFIHLVRHRRTWRMLTENS